MDAAAEIGRNPVSKHQVQPEYGDEQADAGRDGTAEPVSRGQTLRHVRGQGNILFPCSADHEQDWQPHPVDPYSALCDGHTYIYIHTWYRVSPTEFTICCYYCWMLILLIVHTVKSDAISCGRYTSSY